MVLASPWLVVTPDATLRVFIHEAFWGGCRGSIFEDGRAFLRMQQQHSEVTNGQVGTQIAEHWRPEVFAYLLRVTMAGSEGLEGRPSLLSSAITS